ncbi:MAG TPA: S8 family serine peptidase, partial [Chitinophagales bacterium]|nr:S8 family serine peptidase [Chitinophagales bacterium]
MKKFLPVLLRKIQLICLLCLFPAFVFSQNMATMNPALVKALKEDPSSTRLVSLLVQGEPNAVQAAVKQLGGDLKYTVGNIAAIRIPFNKVKELAATKGISRMEGLHGTGQLMDERTLVNANVTPVHSGFPPLTQSYDGTGVVMAVLDDGIDFLHPDFQNQDGSTRVKYLWDQTYTTGGTTPEPYGYGQEWDAAAIDAGLCTHLEPWYYYGHGSNVSGIATGNGSAVNNFTGVAPGCDIISIAVGMDENFLTNMVDATKYAFDKAAALGKPCVINASLGTYFGSHDGYDLPAQLIDELIAQQNGRTFVCAAGNAGNIPFHLGYETAADSSFTWFKYNSAYGGIFYEWWIDKS